jgi:hypothetical protein
MIFFFRKILIFLHPTIKYSVCVLFPPNLFILLLLKWKLHQDKMHGHDSNNGPFLCKKPLPLWLTPLSSLIMPPARAQEPPAMPPVPKNIVSQAITITVMRRYEPKMTVDYCCWPWPGHFVASPLLKGYISTLNCLCLFSQYLKYPMYFSIYYHLFVLFGTCVFVIRN